MDRKEEDKSDCVQQVSLVDSVPVREAFGTPEKGSV